MEYCRLIRAISGNTKWKMITLRLMGSLHVPRRTSTLAILTGLIPVAPYLALYLVHSSPTWSSPSHVLTLAAVECRGLHVFVGLHKVRPDIVVGHGMVRAPCLLHHETENSTLLDFVQQSSRTAHTVSAPSNRPDPKHQPALRPRFGSAMCF